MSLKQIIFKHILDSSTVVYEDPHGHVKKKAFGKL